MSGFRVGVIQMNSGAEVAANLQHARTLLQDAANDGASLVVLPENFAAMGADDTCRISLAETDGVGPVQDFLAETAARLGVWVVGGSVPLKSADPERPYSSCLVFDDAGRRCGRYDKMHLFDVDCARFGRMLLRVRGDDAGCCTVAYRHALGRARGGHML